MRTLLKTKKASKRKRRPTVAEKEKYGRLLAMLQTAVLSTKYTLKQQIKTIEMEYHKRHGTIPTDSHQEYSLLCAKLDHTRKLCNLWHTFEM